MRVLVSREAVKGDRETDFCWTEDDEILVFPMFVCEGKPAYREKCGCGRSFTGSCGS